MRKILGIYSGPRPHWVGDGFPVRSLFSHSTHGAHVSPFLLLDYAGPAEFTPLDRKRGDHKRGVGEHPHRGFETVTIVYKGEVAHRDSTGAGGLIGPGDVQWMTAAAGILHEEFHSPAFTRTGGTLEMVQLWVNLPAQEKNVAPRYQTLLDQDIPAVDLPAVDQSGGAGRLRVIAGDYAGHRGPAHTFSPINVWDLQLHQGGTTTLNLPDGHTLGLAVLRGTVLVNGTEIAREAQFVMLDRTGGDVSIEANTDASILILSGEPLGEPVVMHGPFVMNTEDEIRQAMADFQSGRFGSIPAASPTAPPTTSGTS